MARKGIVDMVVTEDSDLVLFGCPRVRDHNLFIMIKTKYRMIKG